MSNFQKQYSKEIKEILSNYPKGEGRSAVMPLLYLAQRENGRISRHDIADIAGILGMSTTDVMSIIGFYTLYHHEGEKARYHIQVCTDLACALCGADHFLDELCRAVGIKPGDTTPDGLITIEEVTCLAGCDKAPLFQVQDGDAITYHEKQSPQSAMAVVDQLRKDVRGGGD